MAAKLSGGYTVEVVYDNDKERFKCMLCLDIIKSATHGCMNHVFCKECIDEYIESNVNNEELLCPAGCGKSFNKECLQANNPIDQFVNQIACKCPDCHWKGELYDFVQKHELSCEEKKIPCHLCGALIKRKDFEIHVSETCRNRKVGCKFCLKLFCFDDHSAHESTCGNSEIECLYGKFGCKEKVKRKFKDIHNEKNNQRHLEMVTEYFVEEHKYLRSANKDLVLENIELRKSVQSMISSNEKVTEKMNQLKYENAMFKNRFLAMSLHVLKPVLSKELIQNKLVINGKGSLLIKDTRLAFQELVKCFSSEDFTKIVGTLTTSNELQHYKYELEDFISSSSSIMFRKVYGCLFVLFFKIETFTEYEDDSISFKKVNGEYLFKNKSFIVFSHTLLLSNWSIILTDTPIDISKPDERFKPLVQPFASNYGCLWAL